MVKSSMDHAYYHSDSFSLILDLELTACGLSLNRVQINISYYFYRPVVSCVVWLEPHAILKLVSCANLRAANPKTLLFTFVLQSPIEKDR